jgi:Tfp pilus assembly protein PilF
MSVPSIRVALVAVVFGAVAASAAAQAGAVRGTVEDEEGRAIKGATVTATNSGRAKALTATSDDKGRFAIIGLVSGLWMFVADAPGYEAQEGSTRVRQQTIGNRPVEFVLPRTVELVPGILTRRVPAEIAAANELRDAVRFDEAIAAYQEIANNNSTLTALQIVIGDTYRQKAEAEQAGPARMALYDRAIASYQRALEADANSERARIELAMTYVKKGSPDQAELMLGTLADDAMASRDAVYTMGEVRLAKGNLPGAQQVFLHAATLDQAWMRPALKLGLIAKEQGDREAAAAHFQRVIAADESSPEAAEARSLLAELSR